MQAEAPARGGMLTRRAGPLPVWAWLAIVTAAGVGYYLLKSRGASSGSSSSSGAGSTTPAGDVPDYISQTTVNLTEPAEPGQPAAPGNTPPPAPAPPPKGRGVKPPEPPGRKQPPVKEPAAKGSGQPPIFSNTYQVKAGDTLDKLAEKFGVSRVELAHANGLGTGAGLRTGQELKVPGPLKPRSKGGPG